MTDLTANSTGSMDIQRIMATRPTSEFTAAKDLTTAHSTIIVDDVIMHYVRHGHDLEKPACYSPLAKRTKP